MTMPQGRLHNPDSPQQEVLANGAACGDILRGLAAMWMNEDVSVVSERGRRTVQSSATIHLGPLHYPLDYFGEDEDPVKTPFSEATMHYGAEDLPILAWVVAPGGGSAAAVVDMLERSKLRTNHGGDEPAPYADCKVIRGTPGEILPREIREKMGLR